MFLNIEEDWKTISDAKGEAAFIPEILKDIKNSLWNYWHEIFTIRVINFIMYCTRLPRVLHQNYAMLKSMAAMNAVKEKSVCQELL
ncbi:MAG: hypothetical protein COY75_06420 [Nitrospirae bacterium CG_4_10_14_0_8_um_filter_41_23]|nr:MAG: hypothetical protein COS27_03370 [Nitrospirae bacterium CG02_land_8_20_14_3_00_41_53]PIW86719.1 MAG: hypothetical protein COZ94_08900 [Nitrospirae bacterium CG_4_8_14_3_um_filter_41_47]PIY86760.1 MAG: hypothetical protein COY75_06420 [Nitrospirae bacterium CG_4_10_14_0_8_um_filter_41_23]PJA80764.1 MAG: hypothetical protein CO148_01810 [Nitrospirae bacterium CG_4_9_14_3_um_filter_41_27]